MTSPTKRRNLHDTYRIFVDTALTEMLFTLCHHFILALARFLSSLFSTIAPSNTQTMSQQTQLPNGDCRGIQELLQYLSQHLSLTETQDPTNQDCRG
ncbi:hypothetical protein GJ744_006317 [Endocarpon pusillum]|uniref:Uncharacterized protein n=1 Tax=Endocarpon pusillum TaxID=364733 RepID=A0A8H7AP09_9EURO|nr:hypothetical protein GJ744_006317 [Endocarpon pusillum]